jgi:hypothetical protein
MMPKKRKKESDTTSTINQEKFPTFEDDDQEEL